MTTTTRITLSACLALISLAGCAPTSALDEDIAQSAQNLYVSNSDL